MSECKTCKKSIRGETGIRCAGVCDKMYHVNEKCCGVDKFTINALESRNLIKFICDDCIQYVHNVDFALKDMQMELKKASTYMKECKNEFEIALKNNEYEMKCLLEAIEARFGDRVSEMQRVQDTCMKTLKDIEKYNTVNDAVIKRSDEIYNVLTKNNSANERVIKELNKAVNTNTQVLSKSGVVSYAEAVKANSKAKQVKELPQFRDELPLIIKPKEKQNIGSIMVDLNKNVDPRALNIVDVKQQSNGQLVINSANDADREKLKNELQTKIGDKYDINVPKKISPRCIISGMSFKKNEEDILLLLKQQNNWLTSSNIRIVKIYEVISKKNNSIYFNAILEIDVNTFTTLLEKGKVNIGWEKCRVYDGVDVLRCFKCRGFNHKAADCTNEQVCLKCLANHITTECTNEPTNKCINCMRANQNFNLGLDENHDTNSRLCTVYLKKLSDKKKKIGY